MQEPAPDQVNHIELGKGLTFIVAPATKQYYSKVSSWICGQHGDKYSTSALPDHVKS